MEFYNDKDRRSYVEAMRHLKLTPILNKIGIPPVKQPTTSNLQDFTRKPARGKIELRPKVLPYALPKTVQNSLLKNDYDVYQTERSNATKRDNINQLREDLQERNPYSTPAEGITHKFRAAMEVFEKVYKNYEVNLPLHQRPNSAYRIKTNVNKVLQKVLGPDESILPTKLNLPKTKKGEVGVVDPTLAVPRPKSTEYVSDWKEIELVNIMKGFKLKQIKTIEKEIREEEMTYNAKKKNLLEKAKNLEQQVLENEGEATTATLQLRDMKVILAKKDEQVKALNKKVGDLHRAIDKSLVELDGLQMIQLFVYQMSPIPWRKNFDYLNPIEEDTKNNLLSLYGKKGLGDEMTGDFDEEILYIESLNEFEASHEKLMFFETTYQLLSALEDEEEKNLTLIQDDLNIETQIEELKVKFGKKIKEYDVVIKAAEKMVIALTKKADFEENHANQLETVTKMYGMGEEYQEYERELMLRKIKVQVQQSYVEIFGRDTPDNSMLNQLMDIEKRYIQLLEGMDSVAPQYVQDLKARLIINEKKLIMEEAENARLLAEFAQLSQRMARALAPPPTPDERCRRLVKSRSAPPHKRRGTHRSKSSANSSAPRSRGTDCDSLESLH